MNRIIVSSLLALTLLPGCILVQSKKSVSREAARGGMAGTVGYVAAEVGTIRVNSPDYYPSEGDKPTPEPSPAPTPDGVCATCDGKNWVGDGRPRSPCPTCNADGKKPPRGFSQFSQSSVLAAPDVQTEAEIKIEEPPSPPAVTEAPPATAPEIVAAPAIAAFQAIKSAISANKPLPKPTGPLVQVYRSPTDLNVVDQWLLNAKPQWAAKWKVEVIELPAGQASYFLVIDGDGRTTRVDEYLNAETLHAAYPKAAQ